MSMVKIVSCYLVVEKTFSAKIIDLNIFIRVRERCCWLRPERRIRRYSKLCANVIQILVWYLDVGTIQLLLWHDFGN